MWSARFRDSESSGTQAVVDVLFCGVMVVGQMCRGWRTFFHSFLFHLNPPAEHFGDITVIFEMGRHSFEGLL